MQRESGLARNIRCDISFLYYSFIIEINHKIIVINNIYLPTVCQFLYKIR